MIANSAMVMDFSSARMARRRRASDARPHLSIDDALRRVTKCCAWLEKSGIYPESFGYSTLSRPVVIVPAVPGVWTLFSGRVESKGQRQDGALRYEVFEGVDNHNMVDVRWERGVVCA